MGYREVGRSIFWEANPVAAGAESPAAAKQAEAVGIDLVILEPSTRGPNPSQPEVGGHGLNPIDGTPLSKTPITAVFLRAAPGAA